MYMNILPVCTPCMYLVPTEVKKKSHQVPWTGVIMNVSWDGTGKQTRVLYKSSKLFEPLTAPKHYFLENEPFSFSFF